MPRLFQCLLLSSQIIFSSFARQSLQFDLMQVLQCILWQQLLLFGFGFDNIEPVEINCMTYLTDRVPCRLILGAVL
jgi:hypothetical protein